MGDIFTRRLWYINKRIFIISRRVRKASKYAIIDELMSLPIVALIKNKGQKTLEKKIVNEVMEDMSCYISGLNIVTPQETRLIQARLGLN